MGKPIRMLFFLLLLLSVKALAEQRQDTVSGVYLWTEGKSDFQAYSDTVERYRKWEIPPCTFGPPEVLLKETKTLFLNPDRTATLQIKGGPWAGNEDLGTWQQSRDTINITREGIVRKKFLLDREGKLFELYRITKADAGAEIHFLPLSRKRYYRKQSAR